MQCVWKRGVSKYHHTSAKSIFSKEGRMKVPPYLKSVRGFYCFVNYISIIKMIRRVPTPFYDMGNMHFAIVHNDGGRCNINQWILFC